MGGVISIILIAGIIVFWTLAGIRFYKGGAIKKYLAQLGFCVAAVVIFWIAIVYPVLDCSGFLCGLDEIILFLLLSVTTLLVWGGILFIYGRRNFMDIGKSANDELLDDSDEF